MLFQSGATAPTPLPPIPGQPMVVVLPSQPAALPVAKPGTIGTWYREVASQRHVVTIMPEQLTVIRSEKIEDDDKAVTIHFILTANYHMDRDGVTALGVITCVDFTIDGEMSERRIERVRDKIADVQKEMVEKRFSLKLRPHGDALVIGEVSLPG